MNITADELHERFGHWGEHEQYPLVDWQHEVTENNTRLGY
jgi:hypothetical protein